MPTTSDQKVIPVIVRLDVLPHGAGMIVVEDIANAVAKTDRARDIDANALGRAVARDFLSVHADGQDELDPSQRLTWNALFVAELSDRLADPALSRAERAEIIRASAAYRRFASSWHVAPASDQASP